MLSSGSQVTIEPLRRATDARGFVFEPLDAPGLNSLPHDPADPDTTRDVIL